jgi:hypothetical protein
MSVIGSNVLAGASGQGGGYNLTKSLRFRQSASAYLSRTPASNGTRTTWTWSAWVKRGTLGSQVWLLGAGGTSNPREGLNFDSNNNLNVASNTGGSPTYELISSATYRDTSAWYHIVYTFDSTQATSSNRIRLYVNGVQITAFGTATYPSQNTNAQFINSTSTQIIGGLPNTGIFDGYMAEVNFIDGQALTPSSFGETSTSTGVWIPKKYTGTYGTNGFYLPFTDTTSTSTLGTDFSGNSNTWTVNNISLTAGSTYDSMTDVPTLTSATTANYATFNPIGKSSVGSSTPSNGNLNVLLDRSSNDPWIQSTIAFPSSGKWYLEYSQTSINTTSTPYNTIGVMDVTTPSSTPTSSVTGLRGYQLWNGNKRSGTTSTSYGSGTALNDIIGVAVDMDSGKIWFAVNNTWVNSGSPTGGTNAAFTDLTGTTWSFFNSILGETTSNSWVNFGQRPFSYTPPTGFVALNTFNLPTPTIGATASSQANKYFDATTYTGNGTSGRVLGNSGGFQADLVWIKGRSVAWNHQLADIIRGGGKSLQSNLTDAEVTNEQYGYVSAFSSSGFTLTTGSLGADLVNNNTSPYVAWQWKANGTGVTNTAGSITSTVSANTTAGFSIVTYTGSGSAATVGHGLGATPSMIIIKDRDNGTYDWNVYHASLSSPTTLKLYLNLSDAENNGGTNSGTWNSTAPTSTVFSLGTFLNVNKSGDKFVAYCFAQVAGYSAFGSYTGNGSTDGAFIFTGFRPRYLMIKSTSVESWELFDTSRSPYNQAVELLEANASGAENTSSTSAIDILSNGFKQRNTRAATNGSGTTYIYMAFAENPFKYSNAR